MLQVAVDDLPSAEPKRTLLRVVAEIRFRLVVHTNSNVIRSLFAVSCRWNMKLKTRPDGRAMEACAGLAAIRGLPCRFEIGAFAARNPLPSGASSRIRSVFWEIIYRWLRTECEVKDQMAALPQWRPGLDRMGRDGKLSPSWPAARAILPSNARSVSGTCAR